VHPLSSVFILWGPSIKYVTLFLANFDPPPSVTLCHTPWDLPKVRLTSRTPRFLVGLVQKTRTKPPVQILSQLFTGLFVRMFCQGVFCLEGFVRGCFCPFPLLSEYICCNRKLKITLNFMFHMYDKKIISVTSHALYPPPPCHKLSHLLGPPPLSSVTYFMDGPWQSVSITKITGERVGTVNRY